MQGVIPVAGGVLNREAGDTGLDAEANALRNPLGIGSVSRLKICVHGKICRADDLFDVPNDRFARESSGRVRKATRKPESGTGRGDSRKAQRSEKARGPDIPGIGHNETTALMELPKRGASID
jgi:hypothetical protein